MTGRRGSRDLIDRYPLLAVSPLLVLLGLALVEDGRRIATAVTMSGLPMGMAAFAGALLGLHNAAAVAWGARLRAAWAGGDPRHTAWARWLGWAGLTWFAGAVGTTLAIHVNSEWTPATQLDTGAIAYTAVLLAVLAGILVWLPISLWRENARRRRRRRTSETPATVASSAEGIDVDGRMGSR